jgi:hypothetical protein
MRRRKKMELTLTFDIKDIKKDLSNDGDFDMSDFWNAHSFNWEDSENPTTNELKDSIKSEIECWLEDLGLRFGMKEGGNSQQAQIEKLKDVLWEFIKDKDITQIEERLTGKD